MLDEFGNTVSEKEIIKAVCDHLAEAVGIAYKLESPEGHALAWLADMAQKYGEVIYRDYPVLYACSDYNKFERSIPYHSNPEPHGGCKL